MKHTWISCACLALVLVYSIFTFNYVKDFKSEIEYYISNSDMYITEIEYEKIKNIYDSKKSILRFIINNDYTDEFENIIISLDNAIKFDNKDSVSEQINLLKINLERIMMQNKFRL